MHCWGGTGGNMTASTMSVNQCLPAVRFQLERAIPSICFTPQATVPGFDVRRDLSGLLLGD